MLLILASNIRRNTILLGKSLPNVFLGNLSNANKPDYAAIDANAYA